MNKGIMRNFYKTGGHDSWSFPILARGVLQLMDHWSGRQRERVGHSNQINSCIN